MRCTREVLLVSGLVLAAFAPVQAQDEGGVSFFVLGGSQTKPTSFDVKRNVSYGSGFHAGGGVLLQLYRNVAIRGDVAFARSSGDETGAINEPVDLNRLYGSGALQLQMPLGGSLTPYVFGGGGVVNLKRDAESYKFDLTEGAGVVGGGVRFRFGESRLSAFGQVADWIYQRTSVGGTQHDIVFSVGASFRLIGAN